MQALGIKGQSGFSLVSLVVSCLILTISFMFVSQLLLQTQTIGSQQTRFVQFNELRDTMMTNLTDECSIANTVRSKDNAGINCLYDGTCRGGEKTAMTLLDADNEAIYSKKSPANRLLQPNGAFCDPAKNSCSHEFQLFYTLKCADGSPCKLPYLLVEGGFKEFHNSNKDDDKDLAATSDRVINYDLYRFEKQVTYKRPYLNCKDVMDRGLAESPSVQMASGNYRMDPDGPGGVCPFEVYCDLAPTSDGGGWALVAQQGLTSEILQERDPPLYQGMTGRLKDDLIQSLLKQSAVPNGNNVRVKIDSRISRKHVLSLHVPKDAPIGKYSNSQGYCQAIEPATISTKFQNGSSFQFIAASASAEMIGYTGGKFQCTSCDPEHANTICLDMPNGGCCSATTPIEGSVWVK